MLSERHLIHFIEFFWQFVEPGRTLIKGWPLDAICDHLEAVTNGQIMRLLINVPPGYMKPKVVETPVLTTRGRIVLGDVVPGDEILTHRGRYRRVSAVHEQGELPVLKITTTHGRVTRPALDHPYLTPRGWIQAKDLVVGDVLGAVTPMEERFGELVTPEEARLLGYLVGDGCCTHHCSFVNAEEDVIADFIRCAQSCGVVVKHVPYPPSRPPGPAKLFRVNGAKDFLKKHDLLGKSSYTKRIPSMILASSRTIIANFVGAYWSCDGQIVVRHTGKRGSTYVSNATTVSRGLADDLQHALLRLGINARIRERTRNVVTKRQNSGVYRYYHVQTVAHEDTVLFRDMPGLCARKNASLRTLTARRFVQGPLFEDEIVSIEQDGMGRCRCLTVEEDHSFTANDIAVHNSLATSVFWPAWEWGPMGMPTLRYVNASYSQDLTIRDNRRFRQVITSDLYRALWGNVYGPSRDSFSFERVGNDKTGWKLATSIKGLGTGERGDRIILDDPNNVQKAESEVDRGTVNHYFTEVMPTRVNDATRDPIIVIQQRTHEEDVSGIILAKEMDYVHLMIPMRYEPDRHCYTSIGWQDPRGMDEDGKMLEGEELEAQQDELAWPARFPEWVVRREEETMGPYATAGQFQQRPTARGGGIIKRNWWAIFPPTGWEGLQRRADGSIDIQFPPFDIKVASLDTAYTEKQESDYSALTLWGVWRAATSRKLWVPKLQFDDVTGALRMPDDERPKIMLLYAWQKRLDLHGPPDERPPDVTEEDWNSPAMLVQRQQSWGLVEWVVHTCRRYRVDTLLIEAKAQGMAVATELQRLYARDDFGVHLINPVGDKVARAYAVQHLFSNFQVYAPMIWDHTNQQWAYPRWCEQVIEQAAIFPKGSHDDLVDSLTQGLGWLREMGMAKRREEAADEFSDEFRYRRSDKPLYDL